MNPTPSSTHANPDARIDQILDALRTTEPPAGLEAHIAAHIADRIAGRRANPTTTRSATTSYFAVILNAVKDPCILSAEPRLFAFAATALTLLLTISTITILHHRTPSTIALTPASSPGIEGAGLQSRHNAPARNPALAAEGISHRPHLVSNLDTLANTQLTQASIPASTPVSQGLSPGSHSPTRTTGVSTPAQQDPDTVALAETLAPSHPAPPMPLTSQERLLLTATQRGAPIELAELDLAREPALHAAQARDKAGLQQFARSLISQLVTSESLDPTPTPDPASSSSNEPPTNGASPQ